MCSLLHNVISMYPFGHGHLVHTQKRTDFCVKNDMNKEEKRQQMLSLAEQWQQSGKSQVAFARENNIKLFTLRYWIKKRRQQEDTPAFIQLNEPAGAGIVLRYPNGVELLLPLHTPVRLLKGLINF